MTTHVRHPFPKSLPPCDGLVTGSHNHCSHQSRMPLAQERAKYIPRYCDPGVSYHSRKSDCFSFFIEPTSFISQTLNTSSPGNVQDLVHHLQMRTLMSLPPQHMPRYILAVRSSQIRQYHDGWMLQCAMPRVPIEAGLWRMSASLS